MLVTFSCFHNQNEMKDLMLTTILENGRSQLRLQLRGVFHILKSLFLHQTLCCDHLLESFQRDAIGFGGEIKIIIAGTGTIYTSYLQA